MRRRPGIPARALARLGLAVVASAAPAVVASAQEGDAATPDPAREVVRSLIEAVERGETRDADAERELARLEDDGLPALLAELEESETAGTQGSAHDRAVLDLVGLLPDRRVGAFVDEWVEAHDSVRARRAALLVYGEVGAAAACTTMLRLAGTEEDAAVLGPVLESGLAHVLARAPDGHRYVHVALRDLERAYRPYLARALGASGTVEALPDLAAFLGAEAELDTVVLPEIARVARRGEAPFDELVVADVRRYLQADDGPALPLAIEAAGALADEESTGRLVALVASESNEVRHAAHDSLQHLTGLRFRCDPRMWSTWFAKESAWWETRAPEVFDGLHAEAPADVIAAMSEIVGKRLFRRELAIEFAALLDHDDPSIRRLACIGLGQLGSPIAIPWLEQMDDPDEGVRESTSTALALLQELRET